MNAELKKALDGFQINNCRELASVGVDGIHTILPMIHGIAVLLDQGFHKDDNGKSALDEANPELVASAFKGIGFLAALAMLHADEL
ncbi:hypothetical protein [Qipengyuania huizhouensis]|uniref:hypothetical protein n=1 Tax=Qipengyuania huizhouensis TaxID=2867245 RepID=UPI001C885715|nr:hypothetical protein [Qipengyuania huizhouensis]MBX7460806.1 hypothetical protein [Qipengyuania huizhouensis]